MFVRPADLSDAQVVDVLLRDWELEVADVEYAPVGFGSHHWWAFDGEGRSWFATADDLRLRRRHGHEPWSVPLGRLTAALSTAASLHTAGLGWVVAPVPTTDGSVVAVHEGYALALHPRIEGRTFAWGPYEDDAHRRAVLERLVELHTVDGCRDAVGSDDLAVPLVDELRAVLDDPRVCWGSGPFATEARRLVAEHEKVAQRLLDHHAALTADTDRARFVLTHGEPHRANTIITDEGVVVVDWDTVLLGPPERDLWRLVQEDPRTRQVYEERTRTGLDDDLLEAYRLAWDIADVASSVRMVRAPHADDENTRVAIAGLRRALVTGAGRHPG
ncbi:MAG: phosphotransferase [Dermatophilaceae bacterium]